MTEHVKKILAELCRRCVFEGMEVTDALRAAYRFGELHGDAEGFERGYRDGFQDQLGFDEGHPPGEGL